MDNNLGLDPYLFPQNSPYIQNQNQGVTSGYAFDYESERGVISNGKIRTLTADKIVSGTIDSSIVTVSNLDPANLLSGTLTTQMNVGTITGAYVQLDGINNRIIVNDGTTNRIVIGNV